MVKENTSNQFNLGSGQGYTVKEIIEASRRVTGHAIPTQVEQRCDFVVALRSFLMVFLVVRVMRQF